MGLVTLAWNKHMMTRQQQHICKEGGRELQGGTKNYLDANGNNDGTAVHFLLCLLLLLLVDGVLGRVGRE